MSIVTDLQNIIFPLLPSSGDTKGLIAFGGGFATGYFYFAPYLGATSMFASALVGWATARSANKLFGMESLASAFGASNSVLGGMVALAGAPLTAMYLASTYYPMVDVQNSLIVYGAYVVGAYATQRLIASLAKSPSS